MNKPPPQNPYRRRSPAPSVSPQQYPQKSGTDASERFPESQIPHRSDPFANRTSNSTDRAGRPFTRTTGSSDRSDPLVNRPGRSVDHTTRSAERVTYSANRTGRSTTNRASGSATRADRSTANRASGSATRASRSNGSDRTLIDGRPSYSYRNAPSQRLKSQSLSDSDKKASPVGAPSQRLTSRASTDYRHTFSEPLPNAPFLPAKGGFLHNMLYAVGHFFSVILHLFAALLRLIASALMFLLHGLYSLASRSRAALVVCIAVLVLLTVGLVDFGLTSKKIYAGVMVGDIDVAGKTVDEAEALIDTAFASQLNEGSVVIYASEEAKAYVQDELKKAQDSALAEQLAVSEAQNNKLAWTVDASALAATFPARAIAEQAFQVGRKNGGFFARLNALFGGYTVKPFATYDEDLLEQLAADIDSAIGYVRVDCDVEIKEGVAQAVEGHAGSMIDRGTLKHSLDEAFFTQGAEGGSFIASVENAPLRIDLESAQKVAAALNGILDDGVRFIYEGAAWDASAADIGAWIDTRVEASKDQFVLVPYIDLSRARSSLLSHLEKAHALNPVQVTFEVNNGSVMVHTNTVSTMPLVSEAIQQLNDALLGPDGKIHNSPEVNGAPIELPVATGPTPETLLFDEARDFGLVTELASYTTEFATGAGTENRNHNIELASQLLSNSVVSPNGIWSFNDTAGECNEDKGFLNAGAILDGEYSDAIGGGICQVATTIFNAVYEAGLPVFNRSNHSLYIASYPAGRDAAVSWPDLDFKFGNDTKSDILLCLSCAKGSLTATLYGVGNGYQVFSSPGEWIEGSPYSKKTIVDKSLAPGTSYVKTRGTDGRKITVIRTVKDENDSVVREDVFSSIYNPMTEITVKGPDTEDEDE